MISTSFDHFYDELKDVLKNPRPWAHIRYGDGEGIVMGYPEFTKYERAKSRWHKWLGNCGLLTDKDMMQSYAMLIKESVKSADIVGTPCMRHQKVNSDWRNVKKFMNEYKLIKQDTKCCCMDCTVDLQRKGLYPSLLKGQDVVYISCRNVTAQLQIVTGKPVMGIFLPPQQKPFMGKVLTARKHHPEIAKGILEYLDITDIKSKLFLVGAGGLGKIYCMWIKVNGGIALDIGSIFDGWSGLITRSYLKNIKQFQL